MATVAAPQIPVDIVAPVAVAPVDVAPEQQPAHKSVTSYVLSPPRRIQANVTDSKEEFGGALKTEGKYVLLYAYTGEVTEAAEA
jgi:hypothetical protein